MTKEPRQFQPSFEKGPQTEKLGWWLRVRLGDSAERLSSSLEVYYPELQQLEFHFFKFGGGLPDETFEVIARQFQGMAALLEKSADSLKDGNLELGWGAFNAAQRLETQVCYEIQHGKGPVQDFWKGRFEGRALSVFTEGNDKLKGWRKTMINRLLGQEIRDKLRLKNRPDLSEVLQAQQVLSEHHSNVYRRLTILNRQVSFLEVVGALAIVAWVFMLIFKPCLERHTDGVFSPDLTISSLIFGVLGACISGILRLEKRSTQQRIPDQLTSFVYTIARPLVGAVSALAVVIFVLAGILEIGSQTPGLYLAAAFAAGFSERLLELGVGKVDEPKSDNQ